MTPADPQGEMPRGGQPGGNRPPDGTNTDELHNPDVAHEHSDVNVRAVVLAAIGLTLVAAFTLVAMWLLFVVLDRQAAKNDPPVPPMAVPAGQLPPAPRLLTNEPQALEELRASEARRLQEYGWADRDAGVVHLPIEEAKKLLLQQGLPVRPDGPVDPALGTGGPAMGEASSGRAIPVPRPPKPLAPPAEAPAAEGAAPAAKPPAAGGKG